MKLKVSSLSKLALLVILMGSARSHAEVTVWNAFNDFYLNVEAPGGFPQSAWTGNVGVYPGVTGLTTPNAWGYAGGNFNGGPGFASEVGTFVSGTSFYPLTSGGTYAGPGVSFLTGGVSFWTGYNDQYGIVDLPNAQTQIGKYTSSWFAGAPNWTGSPSPNNKFLWLQGTGLSPDTDGLAAMLTWTAPSAGTYTFDVSYVNGNYGGLNTTFAIVDSSGDLWQERQVLGAGGSEQALQFTKTLGAGVMVQFQVGTPAAAQGSPLGLAVNIIPEPASGTLLLAGLGALGLNHFRRRR